MSAPDIADGPLWLKKTEEILRNVDQPELELELLRKVFRKRRKRTFQEPSLWAE